MELKDFVANSLVQICQGIEQAQETLKDSDAVIISPAIKHIFDNGLAVIDNDKDQKRFANIVSFDVAVTAEEVANHGSSGGFSAVIHVAGLKAGAEFNKDKGEAEKNTCISRIQFQIPVRLPFLPAGVEHNFPPHQSPKNLRAI